MARFSQRLRPLLDSMDTFLLQSRPYMSLLKFAIELPNQYEPNRVQGFPNVYKAVEIHYTIVLLLQEP